MRRATAAFALALLAGPTAGSYHFTRPAGWMNDPIPFFDMEAVVTGADPYHLFFMCNPNRQVQLWRWAPQRPGPELKSSPRRYPPGGRELEAHVRAPVHCFLCGLGACRAVACGPQPGVGGGGGERDGPVT
jgi:hypothetical protein